MHRLLCPLFMIHINTSVLRSRSTTAVVSSTLMLRRPHFSLDYWPFLLGHTFNHGSKLDWFICSASDISHASDPEISSVLINIRVGCWVDRVDVPSKNDHFFLDPLEAGHLELRAPEDLRIHPSAGSYPRQSLRKNEYSIIVNPKAGDITGTVD